MNEAVEQYQGPGTAIAMTRKPEMVLKEAHEAAVALQDVIKNKQKPVVFNGEQYIEFEDWQTVGRFFNYTAQVRETRFINIGDAIGWEATAEIIDTQTGMVVSKADAMCLNDEEKWSTKNKYEFHYCRKSGGTCKDDPGAGEIVWEDNPGKPGKKRPKKERVLVGQERVPQFQLRSMAQTRACAKAFGNVLRWVVVLAGYKTTPAEEMPGYSPEEEDYSHAQPAPEPIQQPTRKSAAAPPPPPQNQAPPATEVPASSGPIPDQAPPPPQSGIKTISEKQVNRLWTIARSKGFTDAEIDRVVKEQGFEHKADIPWTEYDRIVAIFQKAE